MSSELPSLPMSESYFPAPPTKTFQVHVPTNNSNMVMYGVILLVVLCCCIYCCLSSSLLSGGLYYEYGTSSEEKESFTDNILDMVRNFSF